MKQVSASRNRWRSCNPSPHDVLITGKGVFIGLGFYLKRFTKTQDDFFLAGRKNSAWVAGLAFLSANLGALELLGMAGNTFKYGMFVVWITPNGAFWGLPAGMGSSFFLFLAVKCQWIDPASITLSSSASDMAANFWRAWWAWLICFVVTILVSVFTQKKPAAELVGLVKGLTVEKAPEPVPFFKTPEFYGILSIMVLVALNLYFW